jgi:hypothetical protein
MEIIIIVIILCIIGIIPITVSTCLKYLVYNSIFKQDKINFKDLIKKSWFFSSLWSVSILVAYTVYSFISDNTDNLIIRVIVSSGFAFVLLSLNYINLKRIEPLNSINKKLFIIFYAIGFSSSMIIVGLQFYKFYPNKIIKLNNISDFNDKISHLYICDSNLKNINLNFNQNIGVLYAEYNETNERIVIIKKVQEDQEKNLFSKLLFNKINKRYLDSNYINIDNDDYDELKDPTKIFKFNDFKTNIIGQSIVYSYSTQNPSFLIDFATSYHYHYDKILNCNALNEHVLNVDLFYDKLSKCLVLVGEVHRDGP